MRLNMTTEQAAQLMKLCRDNKNEIAGYIDFEGTNGEYSMASFRISANIIQSTPKIVDVGEHYELLGVYVATNQKEVAAGFHTHPSVIGLARPSKGDKQFITNSQRFVNNVLTRMKNGGRAKLDTIYLEGIITEDAIAFYYVDVETNEVKRCPLFVDGFELVPKKHVGFITAIWAGFKSGREKGEGKKR